MEVFNFFTRVKDSFTTDEFAHLLHQLGVKRFSVPISQVSQQLKASFRDPVRRHLRPEFDSMMDKALADPMYELEVTRVAENFALLHQAQLQLPRSEFTHFVACFAFDQPHVTEETITANIGKLKQRIAPVLRERLETLLQQQFTLDQLDSNGGYDMFENDGMEEDFDGDDGMTGQQTTWTALDRTNPPSIPTQQQQQQPSTISYVITQGPNHNMEELLQQAYSVLHNDPALCQQLSDILEFDQINDLPFTGSIVNIHQWIQNVNPTLWSPLSAILEQMRIAQGMYVSICARM